MLSSVSFKTELTTTEEATLYFKVYLLLQCCVVSKNIRDRETSGEPKTDLGDNQNKPILRSLREMTHKLNFT